MNNETIHRSLDAEVGWNLYRTGMMMRREGVRQLASYKLTPEQWQLLMILKKKGALSQKAIGELTLQDAPTVSRIVQRLITKGMAKKTSGKKDKRKMLVDITPAGIKRLEDAMKYMHSHKTTVYDDISITKKKQLVKLLQELRANIEKNYERMDMED